MFPENGLTSQNERRIYGSGALRRRDRLRGAFDCTGVLCMNICNIMRTSDRCGICVRLRLGERDSMVHRFDRILRGGLMLGSAETIVGCGEYFRRLRLAGAKKRIGRNRIEHRIPPVKHYW